MPTIIETTPDAGATPNALGIVFGATAEIELINIPEMIINKSVTGLVIDTVDATGVYLSKGTLSAMIPWSNIKILIY